LTGAEHSYLLSKPLRAGEALSRGALWLLILVYAVSSIRSLVRLIPAYTIDRYIAPWYYLDYSDGFVRRGLPGELLRQTWGTSRLSVEIAGWALTFAAVPALIYIAVRVASLAQRDNKLAVIALLILAPLGLTTTIRDPGRYDSIGVIAMAAILLVATTKRNSVVIAVSVATLSTSIAVASEDFLIAYLAPAVAALLYVTLNGDRSTDASHFRMRWAKLTTLALLPGVVLAVASLALKPSSAYVDDLVRRSNPQTSLSADWELRRSVLSVFRWTLDTRGLGNMVATMTIWCLIFLVTITGIRILVGPLGRWYWLSAGYFAFSATVVSIVATDYRRWWTLALLGHFTVVGILGARSTTRQEANLWALRLRRFVIPVVVVLSLYGQSLPNSVRPRDEGWGGLSKVIGPGYPEGLIPFWVQGKEAP
jgi:hypothetical protein